MKPYFLFTLFFLQALQGWTQKVTLSGYVKDASSGETLIGASIYLKELGKGTVSNTYGFYSITLEQGSYTSVISYVGYQQQEVQLNLIADKVWNIEMAPDKATTLDEVTISDKRADANVESTQMGMISLSTDKVKKLPVILGEVDVLKAIQLLPGVQSSGEGNSGFYVRGGGPDQNLVLLDEAVVYNTGHLFGFFSVFNSDAIKNTTLIKGGMPANYGGRLSSVLDVSMKEGNMKEYHAEGGIGLIASRLTLEGPIVKDKGSFMLSGRRTYADAIIKPFVTEEYKNSGYYFYDLNLKANYRLGEKDRIFISAYLGNDVLDYQSPDGRFKLNMPWGNKTATLRWNHQFSNKLFANTTLVYNDYNFQFSGEQSNMNISLFSGIKDWNGKMDFDYYPLPGHYVKFGVNYTYHTFTPSQFSNQVDTVRVEASTGVKKFSHEMGIYVQDEFEIGDYVKINAGLRYSWFGQVGPYTAYTADFNGNYLDSVKYGSGKLVKGYGGFEPRLNVRFSINPSTSIKASIAKTYQYIHMVSNNGTTLPTDIWMPSTRAIQPQEAWQYSLGFFKNLWDNQVETSIEVYYKDMKNQLEYRSGYTPSSVRDIELDLVKGRGYAYGAEFFINKTQGKFTGWIGYTLAWTWRDFKDLNKGKPFPAKYDRRHDLSIVATYEHNKHWTFSGVFIFGTGNAITLPTGYYIIDNVVIQDYSEVNQYRIFPYHRLDVSAIWVPNPDSKKRWKSSWAFSIYNIYSRLNPYILYVATEGTLDQGTNVSVKQISIFPIMPSITYNFKF